MRLPTQDDCDPRKSDEALLWALAQIPMNRENTQPLLMQENICRAISKHLHECGFRHIPKLQTLKMQMPHRGQQHQLNGVARWVPMDAEEPEPVELPDVKKLTVHEQELLINELKDVGRIEEPPPDMGRLAEVTSANALRAQAQANKFTASGLQGGEA